MSSTNTEYGDTILIFPDGRAGLMPVSSYPVDFMESRDLYVHHNLYSYGFDSGDLVRAVMAQFPVLEKTGGLVLSTVESISSAGYDWALWTTEIPPTATKEALLALAELVERNAYEPGFIGRVGEAEITAFGTVPFQSVRPMTDEELASRTLTDDQEKGSVAVPASEFALALRAEAALRPSCAGLDVLATLTPLPRAVIGLADEEDWGGTGTVRSFGFSLSNRQGPHPDPSDDPFGLPIACGEIECLGLRGEPIGDLLDRVAQKGPPLAWFAEWPDGTVSVSHGFTDAEDHRGEVLLARAADAIKAGHFVCTELSDVRLEGPSAHERLEGLCAADEVTDVDVRSAAVQWQQSLVEKAEERTEGPNPSIEPAAAPTRSSPAPQTEALLQIEKPTLEEERAALAANPKLPADELVRLFGDWHPSVKKAAYCNPSFPKEKLVEGVDALRRSGIWPENYLADLAPTSQAYLGFEGPPHIAKSLAARLDGPQDANTMALSVALAAEAKTRGRGPSWERGELRASMKGFDERLSFQERLEHGMAVKELLEGQGAVDVAALSLPEAVELARDPATTPQVLETIFVSFPKDGDNRNEGRLLAALAAHPDCPGPVLAELAKSPALPETYLVAAHPNTPVETLAAFCFEHPRTIAERVRECEDPAPLMVAIELSSAGNGIPGVPDLVAAAIEGRKASWSAMERLDYQNALEDARAVRTAAFGGGVPFKPEVQAEIQPVVPAQEPPRLVVASPGPTRDKGPVKACQLSLDLGMEPAKPPKARDRGEGR